MEPILLLFAMMVACFILIAYKDIRSGLSQLVYDLVKIIILPFGGAYKLFRRCKRTKTILTEQKAKTR